MRVSAILILATMMLTGCGTMRKLTNTDHPPKPLDPLDLSKVDDTHHGLSHAVRKIDE
jgi:hypothetical protein